MSEDEVVARFLRAELSSSRFVGRIDEACPPGDLRRVWLEEPNTQSVEQNAFRTWVLGCTRGWLISDPLSDRLFARFPTDTTWHLTRLTREEVLDTSFIAVGDWISHTNDSRSPRDLHVVAPLDSPLRELGAQILPSLVAGTEPMIAVAQRLDGPRVMLEGNGRLNAFALSDLAHANVIIGVADGMNQWRHW